MRRTSGWRLLMMKTVSSSLLPFAFTAAVDHANGLHPWPACQAPAIRWEQR